MNLQGNGKWAACELGALALLAGITCWLFEFHDLDLTVTRLFWVPTADHWPWTERPWVRFVNDHLIRIVVFAGGLGGALLWALGQRLGKQWRFVGVFMLLSLAIGPGVVVNGILKPIWGRPVPLDVIEFGGTHPFRHISNPGRAGPPERGGDGRSFPSGHASVAFWTSIFYFLLRRRRPRLAIAALGGTLAFGAIVAIARISAGRHFLSDVISSGLIVFGVNWLVYYALVSRPANGWLAAAKRAVVAFPPFQSRLAVSSTMADGDPRSKP
jgi:lipid A 4'-phosphatase